MRNPNRMQEAANILKNKLREHAVNRVAYSRGTIIIGGVPATVGHQTYDVTDGEVMLAYQNRDYFIAKTDLIMDETQLYPASGDRITECDGRVYEVSMPKGLHVFENIGPNDEVFKIHTKEMVR